MRSKILQGNVDEAAALVTATAPHALDAAPLLRFRLALLQFFDLVRTGQQDQALAFAQARRAACCGSASCLLEPQRALSRFQTTVVRHVNRADPAQLEQLQDAMALLAYDDPRSSPVAHLLKPEQRQEHP